MSSYNPYARLRALIPNPPLNVGTVIEYADGVALMAMPGGGLAQARGAADVGDQVFFRDGLIEGPAPVLPLEEIEL